jgi:hypothetical protein
MSKNYSNSKNETTDYSNVSDTQNSTSKNSTSKNATSKNSTSKNSASDSKDKTSDCR